MSEKSQFLGLGKTKYNSNICLIDHDAGERTVQIFLSERMNRVKHSGVWPSASLQMLLPGLHFDHLRMAENRDVHRPSVIEEAQNKQFPFYEFLTHNKLTSFCRQFNPNLQFITHHLAHAYAAIGMSPFEKAIILVMDGAGSAREEFEPAHLGPSLQFEECSVYLFDHGKVENVFQRWITFHSPDKNDGDGIGARYEATSEYIFNSPHASGKVMGLASFGDKAKASERWDLAKAFKGKTKAEWQKSDIEYFSHHAAKAQSSLEENYEELISFLRERFPSYDNLILTGGCALNCTNNAKILYGKKFKKMYVPPFPGDESIGFGLAKFLEIKAKPEAWTPLPFEKQAGYFGPISSTPTDDKILATFSRESFKVEKPSSLTSATAHLLNEGKVIAWFQGRSESGPRALGNRSILVRPDREGIKDTLNEKIKFREKFRPYGCTVLKEHAHLYFDVGDDFENPYMSYAIKVRPDWRDRLKEVTHVDGTSRMQTLRVGQNKLFHELIEEFGKLSGLFCLLNTSLNVMDEPILETVSDAKRFMELSNVDHLVIGDFIISKPRA